MTAPTADDAAEPSAFEAPHEGGASARVAAHLRNLILRGELGPGDRIRQEEVAARFGASRLPVREALRMLEAEGLTEHEPNKGARVPRLSMRGELERGELAICGGSQWHVPLEIRLYRCALVRKANVRLLWRKLESSGAQGEASV